jgi:hypothetical protein
MLRAAGDRRPARERSAVGARVGPGARRYGAFAFGGDRMSAFPDSQPLTASCRVCSGEFEVLELARRRDGACPRCGVPLTDEWVTLLVEESENLQTVHDALVRCLRRLAGLPGNLQLSPAPLWRNLLELVPWEEQLASQPDLLAAEILQARERIDALVARLDTVGGSADMEDTATHVRRLADRMRTVALLLDINHDLAGSPGDSTADAARAAADDLDREAAEVQAGHRDAARLTDVVDRAETVADTMRQSG